VRFSFAQEPDASIGHVRIRRDPAIDLRDPTPITVREDRHFVPGGNRDDSKDSRFWSFEARDDLLGPVSQIYRG